MDTTAHPAHDRDVRDDPPTGSVTWPSLLRATVLTVALLTAHQVSNADGAASPVAAAKSKIAFIRARTDVRGVRSELYVINADGSGKRKVLETAQYGPTYPYELHELGGIAWSPNGRSIAFVGMSEDRNVDVYVVRTDGRGRQRLTRDPRVDGNPAWAPDGRKIAFTRRGARETFQIYVMNADGSRKRRLTRNGYIHFSVVWSPDGQKMLFERPNRPHTEAEELYIMNADGSGQRRLTRNPARDGGPVWSPDGRQIAFTREWKNGHQEIYVMNADGSGQRSLTPARSTSFYPSWSFDGRKIAFTGGKPLAPPDGIFVMNADGGEQRRLTQHGSHPAWSPDGQMIAFVHDLPASTATSGLVELHVMNADGSGERKLMRNGMRARIPFAWSPAPPKRS